MKSYKAWIQWPDGHMTQIPGWSSGTFHEERDCIDAIRRLIAHTITNPPDQRIKTIGYITVYCDFLITTVIE